MNRRDFLTVSARVAGALVAASAVPSLASPEPQTITGEYKRQNQSFQDDGQKMLFRLVTDRGNREFTIPIYTHTRRGVVYYDTPDIKIEAREGFTAQVAEVFLNIPESPYSKWVEIWRGPADVGAGSDLILQIADRGFLALT